MNSDTQTETQDSMAETQTGLQMIHAEPMPMVTDEIAKLESEIANLSARWSDAIATENPAPQDRVWQITCQWNGFAPSFIVSHQGGIHWRVMDEFNTLADAMRCLKGKLNEADRGRLADDRRIHRLGKGMMAMDWNEYALQLANVARLKSKDPWRQVGACLLRHDNTVAGIGFNGFPASMAEDWSDREKRRMFVIHAEQNAMRYARPGECRLIATNKNPDFSGQLSHARKIQADTYADQVIEEAFSSSDAQIGRLRTDALKWRAKVLAPKKYGDKIDIETQSQQNFKISFSVPDRLIEANDALTLETPIELQGLPIPAPMPQLRENGEE